MDRTNTMLGGLLVAQIALAALTWGTAGPSSPDAAGSRAAFEGISADDVTTLTVVEPTKSGGGLPASVELARANDGWVLASADGYPAKPDKVEEVIDKLLELKVSSPIATQASNHNALGVGDREFGRKVKLAAGAEGRELVLGRGAGSSVHVRYQGDDEVYRSRGLSVWAVPGGARSYVDTAYVNLPEDRIERVRVNNEHGSISLVRDGESWLVSELPAGAELDENKVKAFVRALARINLNEPVGKTTAARHGLDGSVSVVLSGTDEDDDPLTIRYVVGAAADDGNHFYVKADDNDFVVTVAKFGVEQARTKSVDDLIKKTES